MVTVEGFDFPDDLFYTDEQIWLKKEDGNVRIGLTAFGADLAGKIKFVRLRPAGKAIKAGKSIGTMESGKWTGPIRSPVTGSLTEVNEDLKANPAMLNEDPYGTGWIAVIAPENLDGEIGAMQSADGLEDWAKAQYAEKKTE
jgi:glycine cleavage system H protein